MAENLSANAYARDNPGVWWDHATCEIVGQRGNGGQAQCEIAMLSPSHTVRISDAMHAVRPGAQVAFDKTARSGVRSDASLCSVGQRGRLRTAQSQVRAAKITVPAEN